MAVVRIPLKTRNWKRCIIVSHQGMRNKRFNNNYHHFVLLVFKLIKPQVNIILRVLHYQAKTTFQNCELNRSSISTDLKVRHGLYVLIQAIQVWYKRVVPLLLRDSVLLCKAKENFV